MATRLCHAAVAAKISSALINKVVNQQTSEVSVCHADVSFPVDDYAPVSQQSDEQDPSGTWFSYSPFLLTAVTSEPYSRSSFLSEE